MDSLLTLSVPLILVLGFMLYLSNSKKELSCSDSGFWRYLALNFSMIVYSCKK
jgi:hypothetical protein